MIQKPLKTLFAVVAVAVAAGALILAAGGPAVAQDRTIDPNVSVEQDQINTYSLNHVLQAGRQFFAVDFLEADGHGEGPNGPRSGQRTAWWQDAAIPSSFPFLRVNGLDSQSCFACHNSAGTAVPEDELFKTQKVGGVGGAADFASVLFGNADFPETLTHIVRTPPRAFGSAYVQELALEMTTDLEEIVQDTIDQAEANPGTVVHNDLITKGVDFGVVRARCNSSGTCDHRTDVEGIQDDLIVRPFQAKGVASTVRSFTKTALDFHHSLQGVEVVGINQDCDDDGLINEMGVDNVTPAGSVSDLQVQQSLGNVLALSAFTGMVRPPAEEPYLTSLPSGEQIFDDIGCSDCHVKSLTTRVDPQFRIELAEVADGCPDDCGAYGCMPRLGSFAEFRSAIHPAKEIAQKQLEKEASLEGGSTTTEKSSVQLVTAGEKASALSFCPSGFYCIDLNNPGTLPGDFHPRVQPNDDGSVDVRLFSDLKRHDLGPFLAQANPEQPDDMGNAIPNREWLTQKLWGVRDNGPWLHDGRARTIEEAIIMHAGELGNDPASEAYAAVQNFQALSNADQQKVLDFLNSLTVPLPQ